MQVKHPPNQITAVYNVTSTTSATTLFIANLRPYISAVIIDGENVGVVNTYTFPTTGEHEAQIILPKNTVLSSFASGFFQNASRVTSVDFSQMRNRITTCSGWFFGCGALKTIKGLHLSEATTTTQMFYNCSSLTSLDVSKWDVSKATSIMSMFAGCGSLTSLDVSNWNTSNVLSMYAVFQNCKSLTSLDVSKWDVSKVTDMSRMFEYCQALTSLDASKWDASSVTSMTNIFYYCNTITSIDVSNWDMSKVTDFYRVFGYCSKLVELRMNTEVKASASVLGTSNAGAVFYKVYSSGTLYYYPHASFVEKFLPCLPSTWTAIDITTLE